MNPVRPKGPRNIKIIGNRFFLSANCTSENESEFFGFFASMHKPASYRKEKKILQIISLLSIYTTPGFNR